MQILVIGAHPDDELFAAGLIAQYASQGHAVTILTTTRGEGGSAGDPPLCSREELGAFRERESRACAAALGAQEPRFLPYRDPVIGPDHTLYPIDASIEEFSAAIADVIAELQPAIIVTHGAGGEYGHPQHIYTHQAVMAALKNLLPWQPDDVLTWCAAYPEAEPNNRLINWSDPADLVLDVTPWIAQKIAGFEAHRTQHGVFLRNNPTKSLADIVSRVESFHRIRELPAVEQPAR